jgi:hypothetical protein
MVYHTAIVKYENNLFEPGIHESQDYFQIMKYARDHAYCFFYEPMGVDIKTYVEIYRTDMPYHFYQRYNLEIKPIHIFHDEFTHNATIIQRWWRKVHCRRQLARLIINKYVYRALWNPYTQLGKNVLLNIFFKMQTT